MTSPEPARAGVGLRSERGPVLLAVMLTTALVALDATILATAVPSVVDDLGGFSQFPFLFSVYLLAQAVSVPVYGKLSDIVGRRPIMLFGVAVFLLGSVLCGIAWSMPALIAFRAVQGLGAGAILPMGMTILGDLYSVAERARVQGYVASMWGVSSVLGPSLGGFFSDYATWRWIFFINLPVGLAATFMLLRRFHEKVERRRHRIDYAGVVLLAVGFSLLILGLLEGGVLWPWASVTSLVVLGTAVVLLTAFVVVESKVAEPVLPLWVFGHRLLVGTTLTSLTVGALLIGLTSYVPLYAQSVLGTSAIVAGFALAGMTMGWPLSAAMAGRLYLRIGFRDTAFIGSVVILAGSGLLLAVGAGSSVLHLAVACFVIGAGLGLVASPTLVAAQSYVDWSRRGVVTGTNTFARSLGSALGIAVFGAIANAGVHRGGGVDLERLPASVLDPAIHHVFLAAAGVGLLMIAVIALIPRRTATTDEESATSGDDAVADTSDPADLR